METDDPWAENDPFRKLRAAYIAPLCNDFCSSDGIWFCLMERFPACAPQSKTDMIEVLTKVVDDDERNV